MSRGWESKSIEAQQQEKLDQRARTPDGRSEQERQRDRDREPWRLALAQTQADLQRACHPAHREMLRLRMEAIQAELEKLGG